MNNMKKILLILWLCIMVILVVLTFAVVKESRMNYMYAALCIGAVVGIDILRSKPPKKNAKPFISDPVKERGLTNELNIMASVLEADPSRKSGINYIGPLLSANSKPRIFDPAENAIAQKILWGVLFLAIVWCTLKALQVM